VSCFRIILFILLAKLTRKLRLQDHVAASRVLQLFHPVSTPKAELVSHKNPCPLYTNINRWLICVIPSFINLESVSEEPAPGVIRGGTISQALSISSEVRRLRVPD
jgi:hypothetical protein